MRLEFRFADLVSFLSLFNKTLTILFEEGVYVPLAAPGSTVNTRVEVRSEQWSFFPEPMVVDFLGEVEIQ